MVESVGDEGGLANMSPSASETFAALLLAEIRGANTPGATRRMLRYAETTKAQGTQLVLYRVLDHISEFEYEAPPACGIGWTRPTPTTMVVRG
jgi:hypothetical protein